MAALERTLCLHAGLACALIGLFAAVTPSAAGAAETENPHWRKDSCQACHVEPKPTAGSAELKQPPEDGVCDACHGGKRTPVCRHRSGITPDAARVESFDEHLKAGLVDGIVECTTCHDLAPHCALDVKQRYRNSSFLRGGPFKDVSQQCFGCHSSSGYRQRSPHMHLRKGEIVEGPCRFCHGEVPRRGVDGQWLPVEYATGRPLATLCDGCHMTGPHPSSSIGGRSGWIHRVVPSREYLERMQRSVAERGGSLPLDPVTGEITCTTCHNPHDRRLAAYPMADEKTKSRLRYENICGVCHEE